MNKLILAGLFALGMLPAATARADEPATANETNGWVQPSVLVGSQHGSDKIVREYDVRPFDSRHTVLFSGAVGVHSKLDLNAPSWFDFDGKGFGQGGEENATFGMGVGDWWSMKGDYGLMGHRIAYTRTFVDVDGTNRPNREIVDGAFVHFSTTTQANALNDDPFIRRQTLDIRNTFRLPDWTKTSLFFDFYRDYRYGDREARYQSSWASIADVNKRAEDYIFGAQAEPTDKAGVDWEHTYRSFQDFSNMTSTGVVTVSTASGRFAPVSSAAINPVRPRGAPYIMNEDEIKFRYTPSAHTAVTAFASANRRNNSENGYLFKGYTGQVAGSYQNGGMGLTARLYGRATQIDSKTSFYNQNSVETFATQQTNIKPSVEKNTLRFELDGRYNVVQSVRVKGGYKFETNRRRNAPSEDFKFANLVYDGVTINPGDQSNRMAVQDTNHRFNAGLAVTLPLDVDVEGEYKKMLANRAVFESLPDISDEYLGSVVVPLPANLSLFGSADYYTEANRRSNFTREHSTFDDYMASLSWAGNKWVSAGADYSYQNHRSYEDMYWGTGEIAKLLNQLYRPGLPYTETNHTIGGHARFMLPKDLAFTARGGYTRSMTNIRAFIPSSELLASGAGGLAGNIANNGGVPRDFGTVFDLSPHEVRITHLSFALDWAIKNSIFARLAHNVDYYCDLTDDQITGWVNVTNASLSYKF